MNDNNVNTKQQENNAKCPFCGGELFVRFEKGGGFCPYCKKEFDCEKAVKLYKSVHEEVLGDEKKVAHGEDYLEVERALERTEFYLKNKRFDKAENELKEALKLTNSDYRVYFGLVRAKTRNFTDYSDETHKPWLDKAIDCADVEEKSVIGRLYKEYRQVAALSPEDLAQYKTERNQATKQKLEKMLKELIPAYMKTARGVRGLLIGGCLLLGVGVAATISGLLATVDIMSLCGVAAMGGGYALTRVSLTRKKQNALFNAVLDVYDALDELELQKDDYFSVLEALKACVDPFSRKNSLNDCEKRVAEVTAALINSKSEAAIKFVGTSRELGDYIPQAEEQENEQENG